MQDVAKIQTNLKKLVNDELENKSKEALQSLEKLNLDLENNSDYINANEDKKTFAKGKFLEIKNSIESEKLIPLINTTINNFKDQIYPAIIISLRSNGENVPETEIVNVRSIRIPTQKTILETETDIDIYVDSFKEELKKEIRLGKKVST